MFFLPKLQYIVCVFCPNMCTLTRRSPEQQKISYSQKKSSAQLSFRLFARVELLRQQCISVVGREDLEIQFVFDREHSQLWFSLQVVCWFLLFCSWVFFLSFSCLPLLQKYTRSYVLQMKCILCMLLSVSSSNNEKGQRSGIFVLGRKRCGKLQSEARWLLLQFLFFYARRKEQNLKILDL